MHKSFAALLLFVGLAVIAIRLGPVLWSKGVPPVRPIAPKTTAPLLPVAGEAAPPKSDLAPRSEPSLLASETAGHVAAIHTAKISARSTKGTISVSSKAASDTAPATVAPAPNPATLDIEVEHKFAEARLSIWVDSHLSYTHALEGTDKKRLVVFHKVEGHEFHAIQIPPGSHQLKVRIVSEPSSVDRTDTISGDFSGGTEKMLRIRFDKHSEMSLSLE
jgi:hypothetical protein